MLGCREQRAGHAGEGAGCFASWAGASAAGSAGGGATGCHVTQPAIKLAPTAHSSVLLVLRILVLPTQSGPTPSRALKTAETLDERADPRHSPGTRHLPFSSEDLD